MERKELEKIQATEELGFYVSHSPYSDPGNYAPWLETLPSDIPGLCRAVRGLVVHYRASGLEFPPERLAEVDTRWVRGMLETLHCRDDRPLGQSREPFGRLVGCCRDFTLLFVAALRQRGVPARSRVGFATYFSPGFNHDHVVAEYWDGRRWVMVDPEIAPERFGFDVQDLPRAVFLSAAEVWQGLRRGRLDAERFGVAPGLPWKGGGFVRNYVLKELAHLNKLELLLWDEWGPMSDRLEGDLCAIDHAAEVLLSGEFAAIRALYGSTPEFRAGPQVMCLSPTGNARAVAI